MHTNLKLKVIVAVAVPAVVFPAMAQTRPQRDWTTNNALWGLKCRGRRPVRAYGASANPRSGRVAADTVVHAAPQRIIDCVHVTFPQCGGK